MTRETYIAALESARGQFKLAADMLDMCEFDAETEGEAALRRVISSAVRSRLLMLDTLIAVSKRRAEVGAKTI